MEPSVDFSMALHNFAEQTWPAEVQKGKKSEWVSKTFSLPGEMDLDEVTVRIQNFIKEKPETLPRQTVDDLQIVAAKLKEKGIEVEPLNQLISEKALPQDIDLVTLTEGSARLQMPRIVLSLKSPVLKALLTGSQKEASMKEASMNEIELYDDDEKAAQDLFTFLKTGTVDLTDDNVWDILTIAHKYNVSALQDQCERWLIERSKDPEVTEEIIALSVNSPFNLPLLKEGLLKELNEALATFLANPNLESPEANFIRHVGGDLKSLDLKASTLPVEAFSFLLKHCPNITNLELQSYAWLSDDILKEVADKLKNLNQLTVFPGMDATAMMRVTDASIIEIATKSKNLTKLALIACVPLTHNSIKEIANLTNLTDLYLNFLPEVTDESIKEIANNLGKLKTSKLTTLNLWGCARLTNASITEVAKHLPNLETLNLSDCTLITNESLKVIGDNLKNLKKIILSNNPLITNEAKEELKVKLPNVQIAAF